MDSGIAVAISFALQIDPHAAVAVHSVMAVVNFFYLLVYLCFLGVIVRFPLLSVVIVGIRPYPQPSQQPAYPEFLLMFLNESVSL